MRDHHRTNTARRACIAGLALIAAFTGSVPATAFAVTEQTARELDKLGRNVDRAAKTYTEAAERSQKLEDEVAISADEILRIEQEQLPRHRADASRAVSQMYKMNANGNAALMALLGSGSLSELITTGKYLNAIQAQHVNALNALKQTEDELNRKLDELGQAKDKAQKESDRALDALGQARSAAREMRKRADGENAEEARAAQEAARKAAELEAQEAARQEALQQQSQQQPEGPGLKDPANKPSPAPAPQPAPNQQPAPQPAPQPQPTPQPQPAPQPAPQPDNGGWLSGKASYYGIGDGFLGGITASGQPVTETSMGVAMLNVPLGTRVEIRFRGTSVVAVVNDRGPYVHGRVIDMQPAVARALDFVSVGVGTVEYRFL